MNTRQKISTLAMTALFLTGFGCGNKEAQAPPPEPQTPAAAPSAAEQATATAQTQSEAIKQAVQESATNLQGQAQAQTEVVKQAPQETATNLQAQAAAGASNIQSILDQVQKLITENKVTNALALLDSLKAQQLTPDQQSLVQKLRDQIQKLGEAKGNLTDQAPKAVGGLLPPANK